MTVGDLEGFLTTKETEKGQLIYHFPRGITELTAFRSSTGRKLGQCAYVVPMLSDVRHGLGLWKDS